MIGSREAVSEDPQATGMEGRVASQRSAHGENPPEVDRFHAHWTSHRTTKKVIAKQKVIAKDAASRSSAASGTWIDASDDRGSGRVPMATDAVRPPPSVRSATPPPSFQRTIGSTAVQPPSSAGDPPHVPPPSDRTSDRGSSVDWTSVLSDVEHALDPPVQSHAAAVCVDEMQFDDVPIMDIDPKDVSPKKRTQTDIVQTHRPGHQAAVADRGAVPFSAGDAPIRFFDLTEAEMLRIALQHAPVLRPLGIRVLDSPDSAQTVFDPAIDRSDPFFGPAAALSEFDTRLAANLNSQNNDRVFNNRTLGGLTQQLTQDLVTSDIAARRRTFSGGIWEGNIRHLYDDNNRGNNLFRNYYETQWEVGYRHPFLRGSGKTFNLIAGPSAQPGFNFSNGIWIARNNTDISQADFEIALRDYVRDLYVAYWSLQRSYLQYDAAVAAAETAEQIWRSVEARKFAGAGGGDAAKEAQARARYHASLRRVQTSLDGEGQGGLYDGQRTLRRMIGLPIVDGEVLRPVDAAPETLFTFDHNDLQSRAIASRTELRRQRLRVRNQRWRMIASRNFLLPQLDGISRYRLRGFGDDLAGGGSGRFSDAYDDFFSLDHQEWEFGVEMGVTVGRRQAHAAVRHATLELQREMAVEEQMREEVRLEVASAHAEVRSAHLTLETSSDQADAAADRLDASMALYEAGKLRIEFLLDAQQELLVAQTQLAADQSRYALSLVGVGVATGSLLSDLGVGWAGATSCGHDVVAVSNPMADRRR